MYKEHDRSTIQSERDLAPGIPKRHRSVEDIFENIEHDFHRRQARQEQRMNGSCTTDEQPTSTASLSTRQSCDSAKTIDQRMILSSDAVSIHPKRSVRRESVLGTTSSCHRSVATKTVRKRRSTFPIHKRSISHLPTLTEFCSVVLDVEDTQEVV